MPPTVKGRVLYGTSGRLTADRAPPGLTNTLNIPDGFSRTMMLMVDSGDGGCWVFGRLSRGNGPETTKWEQVTLMGADDIATFEADTALGGLAVTALKPGNWVCRMVGAPE